MKLKTFSDSLTDIQPQLLRYILKKQTDALGSGTLTIPQFVALHLLESSRCLKMRDIARELNITFPSATALVKRLYNLKMVKRTAEPNDRRIVYIELTQKGRKAVKAIRSQRRKVIKDIFSGLTEKERTDYLRIIMKIKQSLDRRRS